MIHRVKIDHVKSLWQVGEKGTKARLDNVIIMNSSEKSAICQKLHGSKTENEFEII